METSFLNYNLLKVVFWDISWLILNVLIGTVNKSIFYFENFSFPVFLTAWHMLCCLIFSAFFLHWSLIGNSKSSDSPPFDYFLSFTMEKRVFIMSLIFCLSVTSGNISLHYVFVSFTQMVGAATPVVTIIISQLFTQRKYHFLALISTFPMSFGVMLCTTGEINFNWIGFIFVAIALFTRAIKSIISEILLKTTSENTEVHKLEPIELLFHMSKYSLVLLLLISFFIEGPELINFSFNHGFTTFGMSLFVLSGLISFFLNVTNFFVTSLTSAVALQVLGNVKIICSVVFSVFIFKNQISRLSAIGFIISLSGVILYNYSSLKKKSNSPPDHELKIFNKT